MGRNMTPRTILASLLLLFCAAPAFADFDVCNDGEKVPLKLVIAYREVSIISQRFHLLGWYTVAPGDCRTIQHGDIDGHEYWLHAVAKAVTLTADYARPGTPDDRKFCISAAAMDLSSVAGDSESCEAGAYLASFPIWNNAYQTSEITVHLHPDSVPDAAGGTAGQTTDTLPSLYGALALASDGGAVAHALEQDSGAARDKALSGCNKQATQGASCQVVMEFADRCMALFTGDKNRFFIVTGNRRADAEHTVAWGLERCKARGNATCKQEIVLCSTYEAQAEARNQRNAEIEQRVIEGMSKAVGEIYRQGNK